jgi:hypothetical protein
MLSMVEEIGPFFITDDFNITSNPYRWNKNVSKIEQTKKEINK